MNRFKEAYWRNVYRLQQLINGTEVRKLKYFLFLFFKIFFIACFIARAATGFHICRPQENYQIDLDEIFVDKIYVVLLNLCS